MIPQVRFTSTYTPIRFGYDRLITEGPDSRPQALTDAFGLAADIEASEAKRIEDLTDRLLTAFKTATEGNIKSFRTDTELDVRNRIKRTLLIVAEQLLKPQEGEKTIAARLEEPYDDKAILVIKRDNIGHLKPGWTNKNRLSDPDTIFRLVEYWGNHFGGFDSVQAARLGRVLEEGMRSDELGIPYFHPIADQSSTDQITLFCCKPILTSEEKWAMSKQQ